MQQAALAVAMAACRVKAGVLSCDLQTETPAVDHSRPHRRLRRQARRTDPPTSCGTKCCSRIPPLRLATVPSAPTPVRRHVNAFTQGGAQCSGRRENMPAVELRALTPACHEGRSRAGRCQWPSEALRPTLRSALSESDLRSVEKPMASEHSLVAHESNWKIPPYCAICL
jgi:hypothetical protein